MFQNFKIDAPKIYMFQSFKIEASKKYTLSQSSNSSNCKSVRKKTIKCIQTNIKIMRNEDKKTAKKMKNERTKDKKS